MPGGSDRAPQGRASPPALGQCPGLRGTAMGRRCWVWGSPCRDSPAEVWGGRAGSCDVLPVPTVAEMLPEMLPALSAAQKGPKRVSEQKGELLPSPAQNVLQGAGLAQTTSFSPSTDMGRGCQCPRNSLFSTHFTGNKTCEPVSGAGLAHGVSRWRRAEVQPRACVSQNLPSPPGCGGLMACGDLNLLFPPSGQLSPSALAFNPSCPSRELLPSCCLWERS